MLHITGCNIQCDMGEFDKTMDNIRAKNLRVIVRDCNIGLTNCDNSISGVEKTFYKMALKDNRVISQFIGPSGELNITEEDIRIDGSMGMSAFIGNMIRYIE